MSASSPAVRAMAILLGEFNCGHCQHFRFTGELRKVGIGSCDAWLTRQRASREEISMLSGNTAPACESFEHRL
jgi:hypothetical protein